MKHWSKDYPWRQIQTNLREIDMIDINADLYVQSLKDMNATVAMINTSGIISSYETDIPYHFQSQYLKADKLETIIETCHKEGIKVIARTDFSKIRRSIYEKHPEWACVYPDEHIEDYNGNIHCCVNSEYQTKYVQEILKETLSKLDVDGIFFNMGGYITQNYSQDYLGICQCHNCKTLFKQKYNMELPISENMNDPVFKKYIIFKKETMMTHRKNIVQLIKSIRNDLLIDKSTDHDFGFERCESNTEIGRSLPHWQYSGSDNSKIIVTSHPNFKASNTSVDFIGFAYRHVAVSPAQQELRLWQGLAACGGLDYYLIGRLDNHRDRSGFDAVKKVFSFHKKHFDNIYKGLKPKSKTLLVGLGGFIENDYYRGWYRLLTESHILFNVVSNTMLEDIDLTSYENLILPNTKYLSDKIVKKIDRFVYEGGTLVASGESGFANEKMRDRNESGLKSLGITQINKIHDDMTSAIFVIDDKDLFPSMENRDLVYFGKKYIENSYNEHSTSYFRLVPPHNYGPPEMCYWTEETDLPGIVLHRFGKGKSVYIPWFPGKLFLKEGHDNTIVCIKDVLTKIAGLPVVGGNVSPMVEMTLATSEYNNFDVLQLVNTSGHFGTTFYPPVPMINLFIELEIQEGVSKVTDIETEIELPFTIKENKISINEISLNNFTVIKIEK